MAYLPYRMYGHNLPIIDIVQTINSSSLVGEKSKQEYLKRKRRNRNVHLIRNEWQKWRKQRRKTGHRDKKTMSQGCFARQNLLRAIPDDINSNYKKAIASRTKLLKYHSDTTTRDFSSDKEPHRLAHKKSLKVLFKAGTEANVFERDECDEPGLKLTSSFQQILTNSFSGLKRKGSFADFIKIKRRRRNVN